MHLLHVCCRMLLCAQVISNRYWLQWVYIGMWMLCVCRFASVTAWFAYQILQIHSSAAYKSTLTSPPPWTSDLHAHTFIKTFNAHTDACISSIYNRQLLVPWKPWLKSQTVRDQNWTGTDLNVQFRRQTHTNSLLVHVGKGTLRANTYIKPPYNNQTTVGSRQCEIR